MLSIIDRFENNDTTNGGFKWETKIDDDNFKIHIKPKGSELTKDTPIIKAEMFF